MEVPSSQWNTVRDVSSLSTTSSGWDDIDPLKGLYTCLACQIGFHSADLQRQHYRTDWYPYLKEMADDLGIDTI